ncbi:EAL domain-containing protein [Massilia sp. GCM10020059]|uniref:EAL domain-containing protein n=1 Tax=Massilia agrisoli TaxID=2892444 RepID=A0ABS8IXR1_9BURK|nr:EAL domain-containing protein [Massilia agrisoli]MCC6071989.1 EAL domain-containing protein [Massilia agrisoli]
MKKMPGPKQRTAPPSRSAMRMPGPVLATLLLGSSVTLALFFAVSAFEYDHVQTEFQRHAGNRVGALQGGLDNAVEELANINGLFVANPGLSRDEFSQLTAPILERAPYIRAVVFQRVVAQRERAAFEAARRRERAFSAITELRGGRLVSAAERPAYRVVDYIEPLSANRLALGLDAASRQDQAEAAQRACASGETAMTGLYPLVLGGSDREGVALLRPVYRGGPGAPGAARCDQLAGQTAVLLSIGRFVRGALDGRSLLKPEGFNVSLYDGAQASEDQLAHRIGSAPRAADTRGLLVRIALSRTPDDVRAPVTAAGHTWLAVISPDPQRPTDFLASIAVAAGGLLVTLLAAIQANILVARTRNVRKLVDERTAALTGANRKLKLLDQAIEASVSGTVIISARAPGYVIEYVNPAFERMLGYSAAEVVGRESAMLLTREDGRRDVPEIREALAAQREAHVSLRVLRKDGTPVWSEMDIAPVRDAAGAVSHFVIAHYDITDKKRSEEELLYRANHDVLTGLANRRLVVDKLQDMIAAAARRKGSIWVMFIDLDRFKRINDSLSHRVGDEFLKLMAERLRASVRGIDVVARLHGDEFLIAFPETGDPPAIALVVQRVMARIAEPVTVAGHELTVSCSAGVAKYPGDGDTADVLIDNADIAMYKAKERGRNNVQCFEAGMNEHVQERLRLERALRLAHERGEFVLHYQPQFDLSSGALVGLEALLRWESPEFGTVAPARFIALAAETGLIIPIGDWVLRTACAQAEAWRAAGLGAPRIAVNLSARQFRQPELVQTVAAALRDTGLEPARLELELTETLVMDDIGDAVQVMRRLRELGIGLSVDDFGTGYSSLASLKEFPVEVLKIDRSFVRDIRPYSHDTSIPDAIISMAHSLGMRVIAEGVESEAQCEFLARNMCDEVQGYLFSRPLPAGAMEAYLREGHTVPEHLRRMYKRQRTLLLVDDEPNILSALRRLIRSSGYKVLTASSGIEGLEVLAQNEVDVIVSDQRMPGMTGVDFLRNVKQLYPDTVRIVLSGFTELQSVTDAVNEGAIYKFLTKPWDDVQLRGHIEEGFAHKEMADENRRLGLEVRTANHGLAQANRQLESVLRKQERQIERDEIVLDVVREGLQNVPLPIIGLADDMLVAFANHAAQRLFAGQGMLIGADAAQAMPGLVLAVGALAHGQSCAVEVQGRRFVAEVRHPGHDGQMRGILITLVPQEAAAALREAAQAQGQPT